MLQSEKTEELAYEAFDARCGSGQGREKGRYGEEAHDCWRLSGDEWCILFG